MQALDDIERLVAGVLESQTAAASASDEQCAVTTRIAEAISHLADAAQEALFQSEVVANAVDEVTNAPRPCTRS